MNKEKYYFCKIITGGQTRRKNLIKRNPCSGLFLWKNEVHMVDEKLN